MEADLTLSTLLSNRAEKTPQKTCIKFAKAKLTYAEIDKAVSLTSGGLSKLGLNVKDRVAILMENCPEYIISYFAILRAGGIAVPINTFLTAEEISYILRDSGCKMLIYGDNFGMLVGEISKCVPELKVFIFNEITAVFPASYLTNNPPSPPIGAGFDENEIAVLLYTSGTTGFPKGVMLTHLNLISDAEACIKIIQVSHKDRVLLFLPLFHSFSFTVCVIVPIYSGASIILLKSVRPFSMVINSILRDRITIFVAVPTIYNILSKKRMPLFLKYMFKFFVNIRMCVSGASALPEDTIHAFENRFNLPLLEGYGLTEAAPVVAVNPLKGVRKPCSVGPPLPGIEVAVVGEDGKKVPAGAAGELIVKGPNVMKGYFNKEEETKEALKDGWLYTGDMAKLDEDGYIYIVDRKKDLIIVDGMNIYPREIEDVVMKHPSVEECAMVGVPDGRGSEIPMLFIKKKEDVVVVEKEIKAHLKGHIAQFKRPRRIIFLDKFPKTATGKIKKNELKKLKI